PFNPTTKIKFSIPSPTSPLSKGGMQGGLTNVSLIVYDILGRKVTTLVNEPKAPGNYEITFNASQLASGVYLYRLTSGLFSQTKKMIVLK
ncbi:MAG TPA: T9SS type A sorting domain-containing protein, partial [Ignavibacteria bacterium]|nr:T9SS type A sorting domain-containing protein [Ignavibacteria bacterium]